MVGPNLPQIGMRARPEMRAPQTLHMNLILGQTGALTTSNRRGSAIETRTASNASDILLFGEKVYKKRSREALVLKAENVFKIAVTYSKVREFLTSKGWEFQGKVEEMEMDLFRNKKTGERVFVEDISEDFPVTFLMGELSVPEFSIIAIELTPEIQLLEVDSSWEGKPTTIVVAMTEEQVRNMFGRRTKMRKLAVHRVRSE